jgi:hypothetical protein
MATLDVSFKFSREDLLAMETTVQSHVDGIRPIIAQHVADIEEVVLAAMAAGVPASRIELTKGDDRFYWLEKRDLILTYVRFKHG